MWHILTLGKASAIICNLIDPMSPLLRRWLAAI
jgi:hypothetical protein